MAKRSKRKIEVFIPGGEALRKHSRGFFGEFKKFILRGNVMTLAVGIIVGGAFQAIVNSLVGDILMPVISRITKDVDFSGWYVVLGANQYDSLELARASGAPVITYGNFLAAVLNFFIMAFVVFLLVRLLTRVMEAGKKAEEKPATTKKCDYCKSEINIEATRCPCCTSELSVEKAEEAEESEEKKESELLKERV